MTNSHWWGFAAMPEDMEYPSNGEDNPLTLICQFHLGNGMVYVLADLDYFFGDYDAEGGHLGEWSNDFFKVLYSPTRENLREHEIRYADGSSAVPEDVDSYLFGVDGRRFPVLRAEGEVGFRASL